MGTMLRALMVMGLVAVPALAETPPLRCDETGCVSLPYAPSPVPVEVEWRTGVGSGSYATRVDRPNQSAGIVTFDAALDIAARWRWLRAGALVDLAAATFQSDHVYLGAFAGPRWRIGWLEVALAVEAGAHWVSNVNDDIFGRVVSGESAWLPYAGGSVRAAWRFGRHDRGLLGLWVGARDDLAAATVHSTVTSCFLGCNTEVQTWAVGGWSASVAIVAGSEF